MNKNRIERNVNFMTSKEQSEILWAFIIDFRALMQSADIQGHLSQQQAEDLASLSMAVCNIRKFAREKFESKISRSFERLSVLIEDFRQVHAQQHIASA